MILSLKKTFLILLFLSPFFSFGQSDFTALNIATESKITALLSEMTITEKIGQTCQITLDVFLKRNADGAVIEPIAIDAEKWDEAISTYKVGSVLNVGSHTLTLDQWAMIMDAMHEPFKSGKTSIPVIYGIDAIHGVNYTVGGTLFPQEIGLAATWNPELASEFGHITAYETKASGIPWNFSPVLDVARQPLWSRFFETLGEDPYLAAEMGKAIICGYQGEKEMDDYHTAVCLKHFVGYSASQSGRDRTPAWIPEKYMQELFLAPFKAGIEKGAMTVMVNSGDVNGVPGHFNYHLLTEVLKDDWGFNGFAVSDWEDFIMLETVHRVAESPLDGVVKGFNAGVDMSMVPSAPHYKTYCDLMQQAVTEELISVARLDDAVRRIIRVKMAVGLFNKDMNQSKNYKDFGSAEHKSKALNSAVESITLLKNKDNILPLNSNQKILVAGPTANNLVFLNGAWTHTWQGMDTSYNTAGCFTVYEAFQNEIGAENCIYAQGAELYMDADFEACQLLNINDFKAKAAKTDVIVLCLGELPSTEKPGDIRSLDLPKAQMELAECAYASGKPVILILVEARPRIIHDIVDGAAGIVQTYLPGDYGGEALVKLLYGKENFSGKLPYSYPKYSGVIEFYDHPRSVARSKSNHFNAYDPEWDFGFGLSYTTFAYSDLQISQPKMKEGDELIISALITNTGDREGQEVVQLYISDDVASLVPAGKQLKGFEKIQLKPNESKRVEFSISTENLKFADNSGNWIIEPGQFSITIQNLKGSFELN
ncbi:MAG: beta-glucosidase [Crocinitomix sp.]|jgi:beta-glucosidase